MKTGLASMKKKTAKGRMDCRGVRLDLGKWRSKLTDHDRELWSRGFCVGGSAYLIELDRHGKGDWTMAVRYANGWGLARGCGATPEKARAGLIRDLNERIGLFRAIRKEARE